MKKSNTITKGYSIVGANRNGTREIDDFYPTPPIAIFELIKREYFHGNIWEPACGDGAISKVLEGIGFTTISSDIVDRGYGEQIDFLSSDYVADNIITNPPYKLALDFVLQAKKLSRNKIAMLLKTSWLEGISRYEMFQDQEFPLKTIYQFSKRLTFSKGGEETKNNGMIAHAWFLWDKNHIGAPTINWIP
jgi:hypothetical protein